jgi:hypothetical protein
MQTYAALDLHSNNGVLAVIDESVVERSFLRLVDSGLA